MSTFHLRITEKDNNGVINLNRPDVKTGRIILTGYSFYYQSFVLDINNKPVWTEDEQKINHYTRPTTDAEKLAAPRIRELVCDIPFLVASTLSDVRESGQKFHLPVQPDYTGEKHTVENINLEIVSLEETIPWGVPVSVSHVKLVDIENGFYNIVNLSTEPVHFVLNLYFTFADNM
jgi:hypothetical protein